MTDPNDPARWSEGEPSPLGELFRAARRDGATAQELGKLAAQLEPAFAATSGAARIFWTKTAAAAAVGALGIAGGWYGLHRSSAVTPAPSTPSTPSALPAAPPVAPSPAVPSAPRSEAELPTASAPSSVSSGRPIVAAESESSLLERARRELSASPARALALTNEHARRFPRGMLAQEREVIAIGALRRLGLSAEAERRAARFDQSYPNSAHQRTVDGDTR